MFQAGLIYIRPSKFWGFFILIFIYLIFFIQKFPYFLDKYRLLGLAFIVNIGNSSYALFILQQLVLKSARFYGDASKPIEALDLSMYSRWANNGFQLMRALHLCEIFNARLLIVPKGFLSISKTFVTTKGVVVTPGEVKPKTNNIIYHHFYFPLKDVTYNLYENLKSFEEPFKQFMFDKKKPSTNDKYLYVHIRSGDIFVYPHPNYAQPPICYYLDIFHQGNFSKMEIIAEDEKNPVIPVLLKESFVRYKKRKLVDDIAILVNAKNVAFGRGTFGKLVMMLRDNKDGISFTYDEEMFLNQAYNCLPSDEYRFRVIRRWRNTEIQRSLMVNKHKCQNICIKSEDYKFYTNDYTI